MGQLSDVLCESKKRAPHNEVPQPGAGVPMIMHSEMPCISSFFEKSEASNLDKDQSSSLFRAADEPSDPLFFQSSPASTPNPSFSAHRNE